MAKRGSGIDIQIQAPTDFLGDIAKFVAKELPEKVRSSAEAVARYAVSLAPRKSGDLQGGIMVPGSQEHSGTFGKVVFDVEIDPAKNDIFVKMAGRKKNGQQIRYYYPASQEYGFRKRGSSGERVPGKYYLKTASVLTKGMHEQAMSEAIDRLLEDFNDD